MRGIKIQDMVSLRDTINDLYRLVEQLKNLGVDLSQLYRLIDYLVINRDNFHCLNEHIQGNGETDYFPNIKQHIMQFFNTAYDLDAIRGKLKESLYALISWANQDFMQYIKNISSQLSSFDWDFTDISFSPSSLNSLDNSLKIKWGLLLLDTDNIAHFSGGFHNTDTGDDYEVMRIDNSQPDLVKGIYQYIDTIFTSTNYDNIVNGDVRNLFNYMGLVLRGLESIPHAVYDFKNLFLYNSSLASWRWEVGFSWASPIGTLSPYFEFVRVSNGDVMPDKLFTNPIVDNIIDLYNDTVNKLTSMFSDIQTLASNIYNHIKTDMVGDVNDFLSEYQINVGNTYDSIHDTIQNIQDIINQYLGNVIGDLNGVMDTFNWFNQNLQNTNYEEMVHHLMVAINPLLDCLGMSEIIQPPNPYGGKDGGSSVGSGGTGGTIPKG